MAKQLDKVSGRQSRPRRSKRQKFHILDKVRTLADVETDEGVGVPTGTLGTVIARWAHGVAFEIEFLAPINAFATVEVGLLTLVARVSDQA